MKSSASVRQQTDDISKTILNQISQNSARISKEATIIIKQSFYSFSRAPIDTAESQKQSTAAVSIVGKTTKIDTKIATQYFSFIANALGSSRKFGERNPLLAAEEKIVTLVINSLK